MDTVSVTVASRLKFTVFSRPVPLLSAVMATSFWESGKKWVPSLEIEACMVVAPAPAPNVRAKLVLPFRLTLPSVRVVSFPDHQPWPPDAPS